MKKELSADIAIVGGGIVGLAHAYMAATRGLKVVLFERGPVAGGASVRNFGLIWPIGQEPGKPLARAMRSKEHWVELSRKAGFWLRNNGSLHLAYHEDEIAVLNEFTEQSGKEFQSNLLTPNQVAMYSPVTNTHNLKGGLLSGIECTVNPREVLHRIPAWLAETSPVSLRYGHQVTAIELPHVVTPTEKWWVEHVIICSGSDFVTLYPDVFRKAQLTKCKLQMMKGIVGQRGFELGPTLCAGLTLTHYRAFRQCASLSLVAERYDREMPFARQHGIHVLLAQNNHDELIIGDSHEYGPEVSPFDSEEINRAILDYLKSFANLSGLRITERWHGVYPKHPTDTDIVVSPEDGVWIVNGLGGAGMTLSFGLAEEVIERLDIV